MVIGMTNRFPKSSFVNTIVLIAIIASKASSVAQEEAKPPAQPSGPWIYIADVDGSNMKLLTDLPEYPYQGSPTWSRDGKLIAFDVLKSEAAVKNRYSDSQVVVVNADGSNPRILIDGAMPSFSPAAKRMTLSRYSPNQGVWVTSVDGPEKELVLLDEAGWGADWSPDGTRIAYTTSTGNGANFVIFNLIEGERQYLFPEENSPYQTLFWSFTWSPDSKRIVFKGIDRDNKHVVGIVDARGSEFGLETRLERQVWATFDWSPDGGRILFIQNSAERKLPQLFALDPNSQKSPELLSGQNPAFATVASAHSPDGKKLAISSRQPPPTKPKTESVNQKK